MGVSMHPRFAATVWSTRTGAIMSFLSMPERTATARGTKVISETSLVIAIDAKKGRATSARQILRAEPVFPTIHDAAALNTPHSDIPATDAMRQNRMQSIGTSM